MKRIGNSLLKMSLCIALSGASMVPTMAQSKFHVDLDYHYIPMDVATTTWEVIRCA